MATHASPKDFRLGSAELPEPAREFGVGDLFVTAYQRNARGVARERGFAKKVLGAVHAHSAGVVVICSRELGR